MGTCCNCKDEGLMHLHVCANCFKRLKNSKYYEELESLAGGVIAKSKGLVTITQEHYDELIKKGGVE